jgi:hypothetical protein
MISRLSGDYTVAGKKKPPKLVKPSREYWEDRKRQEDEDYGYEARRAKKLSDKELAEESDTYLAREMKESARTSKLKKQRERRKSDRLYALGEAGRKMDLESLNKRLKSEGRSMSQSRGTTKPGRTDFSGEDDLDEDNKLLLKHKFNPKKKLDDKSRMKVNKAAERLKKKLRKGPML